MNHEEYLASLPEARKDWITTRASVIAEGTCITEIYGEVCSDCFSLALDKAINEDTIKHRREARAIQIEDMGEFIFDTPEQEAEVTRIIEEAEKELQARNLYPVPVLDLPCQACVHLIETPFGVGFIHKTGTCLRCETIDDKIDEWHASGPEETRELYEYLGVSREAYKRWLERHTRK